jgi:SAM-dependent methyltransferase
VSEGFRTSKKIRVRAGRTRHLEAAAEVYRICNRAPVTLLGSRAMLQHAKRVFRQVFPRRKHPLMDAPPAATARDAQYGDAYRRVVAAQTADPFVLHRFDEGLRWRHVLSAFLGDRGRARVLDVGAGNGAVELAFAASPHFVAASAEQLWNGDATAIHARAGAPLRRTIANATTLPFRTASLDAVLYLETIEHVRDAHAVGAEISRVLRDGGVVLVTTPPRWRYAWQRDPHFGIRGLVLLPPSLQRWVAARCGFDGPEHHVERIYSSVAQVARAFPDCDVADVLTRSRAPRRWFWDAIVLRRRIR